MGDIANAPTIRYAFWEGVQIGKILAQNNKPSGGLDVLIMEQDRLPNGCNAIVALLSYSGFNQEDSLLVNRNAVDRGFFNSTFYRTYKDEERKNQMSGEEEKFVRPDPEQTKGMKPGSYDALDEDGFAELNSELNGGDVLIGKVVPAETHRTGDEGGPVVVFRDYTGGASGRSDED